MWGSCVSSFRNERTVPCHNAQTTIEGDFVFRMKHRHQFFPETVTWTGHNIMHTKTCCVWVEDNTLTLFLTGVSCSLKKMDTGGGEVTVHYFIQHQKQSTFFLFFWILSLTRSWKVLFSDYLSANQFLKLQIHIHIQAKEKIRPKLFRHTVIKSNQQYTVITVVYYS